MTRLWAVARHTFIEALRSQVTAVFIALLALTAVLVPLAARSDSTCSQVQAYLAYSVGVDGLLLSILTILLTCGIVSREIERRHIFAPATKPIARWRYLVGRWAGVVGLQIVLAAVCGVVIYATVNILRYQAVAAAGRGTPAERQQAQLDVERMDAEVFVSRVRQAPSDMDGRIQEEFERIVAERTKFGTYQRGVELDGKETTDAEILKEARANLESTGPTGRLHWRFSNLRRPDNEKETLQLQMTVKVDRALPLEELKRRLFVENPQTGKPVYKLVRFPADAATIIEVPGWLISEGGELDVTFDNRPPSGAGPVIASSVTIPADSISILYKVGSFTPNFIRAMLMILLGQMFLAALAVLAACWLSFPIACLWCFMLYFVGLATPFVMASATSYDGPGFLAVLGLFASRGLLLLLPDFGLIAVGDNLVDGLTISWWRVGLAAVQFVGLWCAAMLAIAGAIFTRRELAKVIV